MGIRNRSKEGSHRLVAKTLDARFLHEIRQGLDCSRFRHGAALGGEIEDYGQPSKISQSRASGATSLVSF